jgi:hypothetical protein
MSYRSLLPQTCTVRTFTAGASDAEGNPTTTSTTATYPCRLQRRDTSEETAGIPTLRAGWLLFLPAEAVIDGRATVSVDGVIYEVDGPPEQVWAASAVHHIEAQLRSVA